jgi:hypothetical protein
MATKFTYWLGAGASAEALPLIKKNGGKPGLSDSLGDFIYTNKGKIEGSKKGSSLWNTLDDIVVQCKLFATPDLYAKFLIETGDDLRYKLLIRLLSNYFAYYQRNYDDGAAILAAKFDRRALNFLTIISNNKKLPDNVRIISWNYDSQIEMAAERLKDVGSKTNSKIKNFCCWPNCADGEVIEDNKDPFLFHINGVAGHDYSTRCLSEKREDVLSFDDLDRESLLSFAWEDEDRFGKKTFLDRRIRLSQKMGRGTNILVIIGYSFPFFNRMIDESLFASMRGSLEKIYFQDPHSNGQQLIGKFNLGTDFEKKIVHISDKDNYHIPFEL